MKRVECAAFKFQKSRRANDDPEAEAKRVANLLYVVASKHKDVQYNMSCITNWLETLKAEGRHSLGDGKRSRFVGELRDVFSLLEWNHWETLAPTSPPAPSKIIHAEDLASGLKEMGFGIEEGGEVEAEKSILENDITEVDTSREIPRVDRDDGKGAQDVDRPLASESKTPPMGAAAPEWILVTKHQRYVKPKHYEHDSRMKSGGRHDALDNYRD